MSIMKNKIYAFSVFDLPEYYQKLEDSIMKETIFVSPKIYLELEDNIVENNNNFRIDLPPWCNKCNNFHNPLSDHYGPVRSSSTGYWSVM